MADSTLPAAFNSPNPATKYALKQVYRDPVTRKAYVYFIDANTGGVLNSLDGYTLWEAGLGVGTPTTTPTTTPTADGAGRENLSPIERHGYSGGRDQMGYAAEDRNPYDFRSLTQSGNSVVNNSVNQQSVTAQDYGAGVGRISVQGSGPAREGTYNVNTPSQAGRTPSDIVSGTRQTGGVTQGFNPNNPTAGYSFGPAPAAQGVSNVSPNARDFFAENGHLSNPTVDQVHAGLVSLGYSPADATAMTANFALENGISARGGVFDLGAKAWGDENSYGLAQWNAAAGRFGALKDFANQIGKPWNSLEAQVRFVDKEMKTTHLGAYQAMVSAQTIADKTYAVATKYEVPMAYIQNPAEYARTKEFAARMAFADKFVDAGLANGVSQGFATNNTPTALGRDYSIGWGISQPGSTRSAGSGAPGFNNQSLAELTGMTGINYDNVRMPDGALSGSWMDNIASERPNFAEEEAGLAGYRSGVGLGPYDRAPSSGFVQGETRAPSFANTNDFYNVERGTSRIGNNPTTGDEFAVARANERATENIFAGQPISERTLSGPISGQTNTASPNSSGKTEVEMSIADFNNNYNRDRQWDTSRNFNYTPPNKDTPVTIQQDLGNNRFGFVSGNINISVKDGVMVATALDRASLPAAAAINKANDIANFGKNIGFKEDPQIFGNPIDSLSSALRTDPAFAKGAYGVGVLSKEEATKRAGEILAGLPSFEALTPAEQMRAQRDLAIQIASEISVGNKPELGPNFISDKDYANSIAGGKTAIGANATYNPGFDRGYATLADFMALNKAELNANYNPAFDKGYAKLADFTGGFNQQTQAGKERAYQEALSRAFAAEAVNGRTPPNSVSDILDSVGLDPTAVNNANYTSSLGEIGRGFVDAAANSWSSISDIDRSIGLSGGYTGRDFADTRGVGSNIGRGVNSGRQGEMNPGVGLRSGVSFDTNRDRQGADGRVSSSSSPSPNGGSGSFGGPGPASGSGGFSGGGNSRGIDRGDNSDRGFAGPASSGGTGKGNNPSNNNAPGWSGSSGSSKGGTGKGNNPSNNNAPGWSGSNKDSGYSTGGQSASDRSGGRW